MNGTAGGPTLTLSNTSTYSGDTFVRAGTLAFTSSGTAANSTIRLGSTTGAAVDASVNLTTLTGGTSISSVINPVSTSGSGTLSLNSQNTSGTNTYSGHLGLDRGLTISQSGGGTLAVTSVHTGADVTNVLGSDIKGNTLTLTPAASGTINFSGTIYNSTGTGTVAANGAGTVILGGTNSYSGRTLVQSGTVSFSTGNASATADQQLGKNTDLDLGVASTSGGTLLYTGGSGTLAKNVNALGSGGGNSNTIENNGGGTLTLSGTLAKNGTTLVLKNTNANSKIVVGSAITGASVNSDLIVSGGTTTLNAANTYNGPTSVVGGGTLALGINNAIPSNSAVTLGDASTTGTLNTAGFTNSIGSLGFGAGGGTLKMTANQTGAAQLSASGTASFGSSNMLDLTGMSTAAGVYKLVSGSSISGTFGTVTGLDSAYTLKYGTVNANELDAQHKATISLALGSNAANVHVGSQTVNLSIANTAPSLAADLNYTLGGVSGSGTRTAGAGASAATGTYTAVAGANSFNITASDPDATNSPQTVAFSQTGYRLASASAHTPEPVALGNFHIGATANTALTLNNTAVNDAFSEKLNASLGGATGNATASGSFNLLAAGSGNSSSLIIGITTATAGSKTGTGTITLTSDGTGTSGLGTTAIGTQTVNVSGTVYSGQGVWAKAGSGSWGATGAAASTGDWTTDGLALNGGQTNAALPGIDGALSLNDTTTIGANLGAGTISLNGAAPAISALTFNGGTTGTLAQGAGATSLTLRANASSVNPLITVSGTSAPVISAPVTLANDTTVTISSGSDRLLVSGVVSGTSALLKNGDGILTLSNANSYGSTGGTTVSAGTLNATNTTGSATGAGAVDVTSGGTLAGTGTVAPAANKNITISGIVSVGDATLGAPVGSKLTLATTGSASTILGSGSILRLDILTGAGAGDNSAAASAADQLRLAGDVTFATGALLQISNPNAMSAWLAGDRWRVFDWSSTGTITGSYSPGNITLPTLTAGLTWDTADLFTTSGALSGTIDIIAVPEPGNLLIGIFCGLAMSLHRRRAKQTA